MFSTVTGAQGLLRHGYHIAGRLGAWTVTKNEDGTRTLMAAVVNADAFRISQRPLAFVAQHQHGMWRWPIVEDSLQITGASLTAVLGPKE